MTTTLLRAVETDANDAPTAIWLDVTLDAPTADDKAKRQVRGVFAPYGLEIDRPNWMLGTTKFRIEAEALEVEDNAKAFYGHDWQDGGMPIGRIVEHAQSADALTGVAQLSETAKAAEVHALVLDGTLDRFSVGFRVLDYTVEDADSDAPVLAITRGAVFEVSIVPYPAYDAAAIESVNSRTPTPTGRTPMTTPTIPTDKADALHESFALADGEALAAAVENLSRQVATLDTTLGADAPGQVPFRSYGDFVKAMLNRDHERHGEAEALATTLAYGDGDGDGVAADSIYRDTWVGDVIRIIQRPRKVWNLFESSPLPAEGMSVEFGKIASDTIKVEEQLAEGEPLVVGKITVGSDTADVITFGGAAKMSFQQAQRSNVNILDLTWRALARTYAKTTEQYVRTLLADPTEVDPEVGGTLADFSTIPGLTAWFLDAYMYFDDKALDIEYMRVTPDVYLDLANLRYGTDGPFLLNRESGRINLSELSGEVEGARVTVVPGTGLAEVGHSSALRTFESSGAPARLGPEADILTLTQAIGVYGFDAVAVQDEKAIYRAAVA